MSTLLTVGYGDIYPITTLGKIFGILITFLGVGMVAIPTGIISAGFVDQYSRLKRISEYGTEADIHFIRIHLTPRDRWANAPLRDLGLPEGVIIAAVQRGRDIIVPRGDVVLLPGDNLVLGAGVYEDDVRIQLKEIVLQTHHPWAKLETLMAGGSIVQHIEENLTYDYLHSSEENLWSVLYLTGYLTKVRDKDLTDSLPDGCSALMIPNAEIREIFETTVSKWFDDSAKAWNRSPLFDAVWSGNSEALTKEMTKLLRMTISYHDYREDFYHAFLAGIFTGAGYVVESNKEHGEGRSDVIVKDIRNGRVAIFEAKYAKTLDALPDACDAAIQQINDRMYAADFRDDYDDILCYGIAFFKKRCMVRKK